MRKWLGVALCLGLLASSGAAQAAAPEKSDNIKIVANLELGRVTELAIQGKYAYALGAKAVSVIDRKTHNVVGTLECPEGIGGTEIETFPGDMIAFDASGGCAVPGVAFVDVSNPRAPRIIGGSQPVSSHTITSYPGKPFVYVSPNGCCGSLGGEQIIDARNPAKPKIVVFDQGEGIGCHDVGFLITKDVQLAACAGGVETQLWDVSDPLAPVIISRIPTPQVFFNHSATFSPDGKVLVVGDEAHGVTSCTGVPTGALWFYDISDPATPILNGYYGSTRGSAVSSFWATPDTWCSAHMYNFKPGTRLLATAWYEGGINVLDLTDPASPQEVGFYRASGDFSPWAAYWSGSEIWTSDEHVENGGVEVFSFKS